MEIQYCSKCKTDQELKYFSITKKGTHYKTCDGCRNRYKGRKLDTDSSTTAEEVEPEKYIIVMDVETNGLIKRPYIQPNEFNLEWYPRIVQFSWGIYNSKGELQN